MVVSASYLNVWPGDTIGSMIKWPGKMLVSLLYDIWKQSSLKHFENVIHKNIGYGGCSSLRVESRKWEKVVPFCRWVPTYWNDSTPWQICKKCLLIIKEEDKDDNNGGFSQIVFPPKNISVHVFLVCDELLCYLYTWLLFN